MGLDFSYSMVMAEALGDCNCGGVPMAIGVQTDMCTPALARFGRTSCAGVPGAGHRRRHGGCIGVSEAGGGSDVAALKTTAEEGRRRLRHQRLQDVDHQRHAGRLVLPAGQHLGRPAHKNKSLIMVPMDAPGITRQKIEKIGMDSSDTAQLFFDNVRVPSATSSARKAWASCCQMLQFQEERLYGAAGSAALAGQRLIDQTIDYTRQRHTFGKPILDNQVVHFRLAELRTEVEPARPDLPRGRVLRLAARTSPSWPPWPSSRPAA
jgi:citronellyl-CoA dehydrogenase